MGVGAVAREDPPCTDRGTSALSDSGAQPPPPTGSPQGMVAAIEKAESIVATTPGAYMLQQFDNPANPEVCRGGGLFRGLPAHERPHGCRHDGEGDRPDAQRVRQRSIPALPARWPGVVLPNPRRHAPQPFPGPL